MSFILKQQISRRSHHLSRLRHFSTATGGTNEKDEVTAQSFKKETGKSILSLDNAVKHCTAEVKKFDFYSYVAGQYMPRATQSYYYGTHALFLEALKSREISREPSICQTRLKWWEEILKDVALDRGQPRVPVAVVLKSIKENTTINFGLLQRLVDYQLFDIERGDMQSVTELEIYAENTRSLLLYMNLHLLRIDDANALSAASHLGRCLGIVDILRKLPFYLGVSRGYLPQDILLKNNVYFDKMWSRGLDGIVSEEFFDVVLEVASYAKKHLEIAKSFQDKNLPKDTHRAFLLAIEAEIFLNHLEKLNFDVFDASVRARSNVEVPLAIYNGCRKGYY